MIKKNKEKQRKSGIEIFFLMFVLVMSIFIVLIILLMPIRPQTSSVNNVAAGDNEINKINQTNEPDNTENLPSFPENISFSLVVLPDTQYYSRDNPEIFMNQTKWIVENIDELTIRFVVHEGDIVQNYNSTSEWDNANKSLSILDNIVPYLLVPGNHDIPTGMFNEYFPRKRFERLPWFGGSLGGMNNSYMVFSDEGLNFVILGLELCPSNETLGWGNEVLSNNSDRLAIVVTHGYLDSNAERYIHRCGSTEYIWDRLLKTNGNVFMVLSGHVHAEAYRKDTVNGKEVHQMLADYQGRTNGGNGWLRVLSFDATNRLIHVTTYSPYLNEFESDGDSKFSFEY